MSYTAPELLLVGAANNLVLGSKQLIARKDNSVYGVNPTLSRTTIEE
jgi:hypothetical protein